MATMTSEALMAALAFLPTARPSASTASLVRLEAAPSSTAPGAPLCMARWRYDRDWGDRTAPHSTTWEFRRQIA
jgi:hypothetical protein